MKPVKDKKALEKRVGRFFSSDMSGRHVVTTFIKYIASAYPTFIFGGMIRDIALFGLAKFDSDIDIVVDANQKDLQDLLESYHVGHLVKNKFGGFRFRIQIFDIDIWSVRDTWAFKNKVVEYTDISSVLDTTLMSWDAILYDVKNGRVICRDEYFSDLSKNRLELILDTNPNYLGSIVRVYRAIFWKGATYLGPKACKYILESYNKLSKDEIIMYETISFRKKFITSEKIDACTYRILYGERLFNNDCFIGDMTEQESQMWLWEPRA